MGITVRIHDMECGKEWIEARERACRAVGWLLWGRLAAVG